MRSLVLAIFILSVFIAIGSAGFQSCRNRSSEIITDTVEHVWRGMNKYQIKPQDSLIRYGRELIENTSYYLGPQGIVAQITNGMNCQNCHLDGGTLPWGNNYSGVASTYPKYRERRGSIESIPQRINDCFQRSLNGNAIDINSREMKAIIAYMHWLGDDIPKKHKPKGSGIMALPYLDRPADPVMGKQVYISKCQRCHGSNGEGQKNLQGFGYTYPPLWGKASYNTGAGLFRLSRFAGYVKNNMPSGEAEYTKPQLTDEQAWDVAAFVNSQPRPSKVFSDDWPDISKKPIDHPFGPFTDSFSEKQHKFGPFNPIIEASKKLTLQKKN